MPRRGGADPDEDPVDLDAPEHAWWAAAPNDPFEGLRRDEAGEPDAAGPETGEPDAARPEAGEPDAAGPEVGEPEAPVPPPPSDPYAVLRIAPSATWDEVVAAHRKLVRWWHPDGLGPDASEEERELSATRMRELSAAYRELRVRRGR